MKYLFVSLLVMLSVVSARAQKIDSASVARLSPELREEVNQYILEANKAHKTGMVMAIGGGAVGFAGALMVVIEGAKGFAGLFDWNNYDDDPNTQPVKGNDGVATAGAMMFIAGAGVAIGSIPMFRKVHKKRNAARAILYSGNNVSLAPNVSLPGTQSLGICVAIPIGGRR